MRHAEACGPAGPDVDMIAAAQLRIAWNTGAIAAGRFSVGDSPPLVVLHTDRR